MNIWPEESYRIFPLSRNQRGIWEMELLNQNSPMNSLCTSLLIKGRMDIGLAARGINRVLEQDVSLRTRLAVIGGAPYQYQVAFKEEAFPFFDFSAAGAEGISRWETVTAQTAMPVTENPLYRFYIYKSGEESGGILIRVHRLIADGWRIADLAERFAAVYFALLSGKRPDLSETP
ncbi:MAG: condensation domain-containing protein, partial [Oscillospiraceae bacterium]|nr:condensation domain-containing protein [Oscillospiraceae bacterium]